MTIRGGGSPRDGGAARPEPGTSRVRQAHPIDEVPIDDEHYARSAAPTDRAPAATSRLAGRRSSGGGGGLSGLLRLVLFIVILAGVVLVASLTVLRPVISRAVVDYASKNPSALKLPFVADLVREDLGSALTDAPSSSSTEVTFDVVDGDTAQTIATRLHQVGLLTDPRSLVFIATEQDLTTSLEVGTYILRKNMTPQQIVTSLLVSHQVAVTIGLRPSLRLEQVTAKLQTVTGLTMDVQAFYNEVKHPPASLLKDYPWLVLPKGASLEGFLAAATYIVSPDITADEFVRQLLDTWHQQVGPELLAVPASRGLTFYQVLTLASVVERETGDDADRALIAGVYQNRLNPKLFPLNEFQSDPTIFYVNDSLQLAKLPFGQWQSYLFWAPLATGTTLPADLPDDLAGYNTYTSKGLMPGPICTPTVASIQAALNPTPRTATCTSWPRRTVRARSSRRRMRSTWPTSRSTARERMRLLPIRPTSRRRPPSADRARWDAADRAARPARLARLRARMAAAGVDAYFGVRREHMRYLTGFALADGEGEGRRVIRVVPGHRRRGRGPGRQPLHDPGAPRVPRCPASSRSTTTWCSAGRSSQPLGVPGGSRSRPASSIHARPWERCSGAAAGTELVPVGGLGRGGPGDEGAGRARAHRGRLRGRRPGPGALLPEIRPGVTEAGAGAAARVADADRRRRGAGLRRGLPRRARGGAAARLARRPAGQGRRGAPVRLRRPGRRLSERHDADAVRRRAGGPRPRRSTTSSVRPRRRHRISLRRRLARAVGPADRAIDDGLLGNVIAAAGHGDHFGHGTGHGIGLATHELPSLGRPAAEGRCRRPTVFSVEPGVYLEGETGVRIEDLVVVDLAARRMETADMLPPRDPSSAADVPSDEVPLRLGYNPGAPPSTPRHGRRRGRQACKSPPDDQHRRTAEGRRHRARWRALADPRLPPHQDGPRLGPGPHHAAQHQARPDGRALASRPATSGRAPRWRSARSSSSTATATTTTSWTPTRTTSSRSAPTSSATPSST